MQNTEDRVALLRTYLRRLGDGESLDAVRADFVKAFRYVDAAEIMRAEQEMMKCGTPITEIQKLCDIHSALFHGTTTEERIQTAKQAAHTSSVREQRMTVTNRLVAETGHPLSTFTKENEALAARLKKVQMEITEGQVSKESIAQIREAAVHYAKKGDLLYPHLKVKYEIPGPSDVMWTVDDEIRDTLAVLSKEQIGTGQSLERLQKVIVRMEEMIYKEANILFTNCAENFTTEEWIRIYQDAKDYADCLGVKPEIWNVAEEATGVVPNATPQEQEIVMAGGHMTVAQLTAMLNTMPYEITFVDEHDINCYFNEGHKDFKRPGMAIGREVYSCHPPKVEAGVRRILDSFKAGTLDQVPVWMEKNGKCILVTYMAVRDPDGRYMGTLELVQDMTFAKEHFTS